MNTNTMHLSLNVRDLSQTIQFYNTFFDRKPVKVKENYAKYVLEEPSLVISFIEKGQSNSVFPGHLGIQLSTVVELATHRDRITASGLRVHDEHQTKCCYALQDKFWVTDPDYYSWEMYVFFEDVDENDPEYMLSSQSSAEKPCC